MVFKKWADWAEGDYVSGELLSVAVDPTYGKNVYGVKLEGISLVDPTTSNGVELKPGMTLGLNAAGGLDYRMKEVEVGDIVEIVYQGSGELPGNHKYKGKPAHQFDVYTLADEEEIEEEESCL